MTSRRPDIKASIKRQVRQRCGYGCVICGKPIGYDYDHIINYSVVKEHEAHNITILCTEHHDDKTNRRISVAQVSAANRNPFNKRPENNVTSGKLLLIEGDGCEVVIGDTTFRMDAGKADFFMVPIIIEGKTIIGFRLENGHLLLTLNLYDRSGSRILRIIDNELIAETTPWDIEISGPKIIIRSASRVIALLLELQIPNKVIVHRMEMAYLSHHISVSTDGEMKIDGQGSMRGGTFINMPVGIFIGSVPPPGLRAAIMLVWPSTTIQS